MDSRITPDTPKPGGLTHRDNPESGVQPESVKGHWQGKATRKSEHSKALKQAAKPYPDKVELLKENDMDEASRESLMDFIDKVWDRRDLFDVSSDVSDLSGKIYYHCFLNPLQEGRKRPTELERYGMLHEINNLLTSRSDAFDFTLITRKMDELPAVEALKEFLSAHPKPPESEQELIDHWHFGNSFFYARPRSRGQKSVASRLYLSISPDIAAKALGAVLNMAAELPIIESCKLSGPSGFSLRNDLLLIYLTKKWDGEVKRMVERLCRNIEKPYLQNLVIPSCAKVTEGVCYCENPPSDAFTKSRGSDLCEAMAYALIESLGSEGLSEFRQNVYGHLLLNGIDPGKPHRYLDVSHEPVDDSVLDQN